MPGTSLVVQRLSLHFPEAGGTGLTPGWVKSIGPSAFRYSQLEKIKFAPDCQVETIGRRAFIGCSLSGEIILPPSVKSLYISSFANQDHPTVVKYHKGTALSDDYSYGQNITYEEIV